MDSIARRAVAVGPVSLMLNIVNSFIKISDPRERAGFDRAVARFGWRPRRLVFAADVAGQTLTSVLKSS